MIYQFVPLLLLILGTSSTWAQIDTVFIIRTNHWEPGSQLKDTLFQPYNEFGHFLYGTCVLPSSRRMAAASSGYFLEKVEGLPCYSEDFEANKYPNLSYTFTDSTLILDFAIVDNCCFDFLCDLSFDEDGRMHLYQSGYGNNCACYCCFGLRYYIHLDPSRAHLKAIYLGDSSEAIVVFDE
jgi:hypothetical protein